jgi:hypothetical protein
MTLPPDARRITPRSSSRPSGLRACARELVERDMLDAAYAAHNGSGHARDDRCRACEGDPRGMAEAFHNSCERLCRNAAVSCGAPAEKPFDHLPPSMPEAVNLQKLATSSDFWLERLPEEPNRQTFVPIGAIQERGTHMSKKAAEHHRQASQHHSNAARHHDEAAKHHDSGHHEKAAHHAHTAGAHADHARDQSEAARKAHSEEYGKK